MQLKRERCTRLALALAWHHQPEAELGWKQIISWHPTCLGFSCALRERGCSLLMFACSTAPPEIPVIAKNDAAGILKGNALKDFSLMVVFHTRCVYQTADNSNGLCAVSRCSSEQDFILWVISPHHSPLFSTSSACVLVWQVPFRRLAVTSIQALMLSPPPPHSPAEGNDLSPGFTSSGLIQFCSFSLSGSALWPGSCDLLCGKARPPQPQVKVRLPPGPVFVEVWLDEPTVPEWFICVCGRFENIWGSGSGAALL